MKVECGWNFSLFHIESTKIPPQFEVLCLLGFDLNDCILNYITILTPTYILIWGKNTRVILVWSYQSSMLGEAYKHMRLSQGSRSPCGH